MTMNVPLIMISSIALESHRVFLAHQYGNWGPEQPDSDHQQHVLEHDTDTGVLYIDPRQILQPGEEFKLLVPVEGEEEARMIFGKRFGAGVMVSERFDYDQSHCTLWFLTPNYPVVRPMAWNQNNVYVHPEMIAYEE